METPPYWIKKGKWCPWCTGGGRYSMDIIKEMAAKRGGKCLSENYSNKGEKLVWQCANGHQWHTTPSIIRFGSWCPHCSGIAMLTLKEMQRMAKEKKRKCVSDSYVNVTTPMEWECNLGPGGSQGLLTYGMEIGVRPAQIFAIVFGAKEISMNLNP